MSTENSDLAEEVREVFERPEADSEADADRVDTTLQHALDATAADEIPRNLTKTSLPAVLLALLEIRDGERHGKVLLEDLEDRFGHSFSPGTVYPKLHDLDDAGVLRVLKRATVEKDYAFQDPEAAYTRIEIVAEQHAAMARFLHAALEELDEDHPYPITE